MKPFIKCLFFVSLFEVKAQKVEKLILFDFYTDWCKPCKQMDKEVYSQPEIKNFIDDHFSFLKINAESDTNKHLVENYQIHVFPTTLILDQNGDLVAKRLGFINKENFLQLLTNALEINDSTIINENTKEYLMRLSEQEKRDTTFFKGYLNTLDSSALYEVENLFIISSYVNTCEDSLFHILNTAIGLPIYNSPLAQEILHRHKKAFERSYSDAIKTKNRELLTKILKFESERKDLLNPIESNFNLASTFYFKTGDTLNYLNLIKSRANSLLVLDSSKVVQNRLKEFTYMKERSGQNFKLKKEDYLYRNLKNELITNASILNGFSEKVLKFSSDEKDLFLALSWTLKALNEIEDSEFYLTGAKLMYKINGLEDNYFSKKVDFNDTQRESYNQFIELLQAKKKHNLW